MFPFFAVWHGSKTDPAVRAWALNVGAAAAISICSSVPAAAQSLSFLTAEVVGSSDWQLQPPLETEAFGPKLNSFGVDSAERGDGFAPLPQSSKSDASEVGSFKNRQLIDSAIPETELHDDRPNFQALDNSLHRKGDIPKAVRHREFAFQALNFVDLLQTTYCLERGTCSEQNPIYGKNPDRRLLVVSKLASGILHYAVTKTLLREEPDLVDEWQIATIAIQGGVVMWNMKFCF